MEDHRRLHKIHMPRLHRLPGLEVVMGALGRPCGQTIAKDRTVILQQRRLRVERPDMVVSSRLHAQKTASDRIATQPPHGVEKETLTSRGNAGHIKLRRVE